MLLTADLRNLPEHTAAPFPPSVTAIAFVLRACGTVAASQVWAFRSRAGPRQGGVALSIFPCFVLHMQEIITREARMLPRERTGEIKPVLADDQVVRGAERGNLGFALIIATVGAGLALALLFRFF